VTFPRWYKLEWLGWLVTGLPLYLVVALYAGRVWPIPDPPSKDLGFAPWVLASLLIYHPFILLPVALALAARKTKSDNAPNR
jgi:hypothetical protein